MPRSNSKSLVSFTEYYLRNLDKMSVMSPDIQKKFWSQREWHPVLRMTWNTLTHSNGEGVITYPDGTKQFYETVQDAR